MLALFVEWVSGGLTPRRGFTIEPRDRIIAGEKAITTGRSTIEKIEVMKKARGVDSFKEILHNIPERKKENYISEVCASVSIP